MCQPPLVFLVFFTRSFTLHCLRFLTLIISLVLFFLFFPRIDGDGRDPVRFGRGLTKTRHHRQRELKDRCHGEHRKTDFRWWEEFRVRPYLVDEWTNVLNVTRRLRLRERKKRERRRETIEEKGGGGGEKEEREKISITNMIIIHFFINTCTFG